MENSQSKPTGNSLKKLLIIIAIISPSTYFAKWTHNNKTEEQKKTSQIEQEIKKPQEKEQLLKIIESKETPAIDKIRALEKLAIYDKELAGKLKKPIYDEIERKVSENKKTQQEEERKQHLADKKRRKKEGVSMGMTMQDVLDSSWGRPQHKTTYHTALGEQTIWQYGEYGERGSIVFENGIISLIQN